MIVAERFNAEDIQDAGVVISRAVSTDGFESLHFYQNGSVADKVMQGSHKPYECGFDSHLNLQAGIVKKVITLP